MTTTDAVIPARVFKIVAWLGVISFVTYVALVIQSPVTRAHQYDLVAYRTAGLRVLQGIPLYDTPLIGNVKGIYEYLYPPFAAILFTPLAVLDGVLFTIVGSLVNGAVLVGVIWLALSMLGYRRDYRLVWFSVFAGCALLYCEPIRQTVIFGQINLVLLALVLVDLALPDRVRYKGVLIGIAAGIKLIPAFFVLYLLVTRRWRAAAVAGGTFVATALLGFAVMPRDSVIFWTSAVMDPTRIGPADMGPNQTLSGMIARLVGVSVEQRVLWVVLGAVIAVIGLLLARRLSFAGYELPAIVLCGLVSTFVSPFSWPHHWVWLGLLVVYLLHLSLRPGAVVERWALGGTLAVTLGGVLGLIDYQVPTLLAVPDWAHLGFFYQNAYLWLTLGVFVAVYLPLRHNRSAVQATLTA
ncbi:glycosyltransferase 87 family protein [Kibdelosporangium philippinense]|uniref:Glycosyltransferase 87 family protein n=1 Tax=Kibdelosporangium philippinense TaxID=211113 RepID=A0ABS8Z4V1_9PSEU|nr:glycosyltransferase 87 family protein [Kibdelosporangium philippinense]MCE7002507.1 glycosyltransferase 87 family protein [Kibdelosporangium philippinense]